MFTDITTSTTLQQISGLAVLLDRLAFPQPADGVFEMRGVLSRGYDCGASAMTQ